jgi:nicotinate-nucleotide adenylyltransferase
LSGANPPATGILGGTFDPVHRGHVAVARQAREQLGLERVLLIPSFQPPHRDVPLAGAADRLAMTRLAVEGEAGLEVDDREVRRGGTSFTVETLRELRDQDLGELVLLLGDDAAAEFGTWREHAAIIDMARLAVFNRAGSVPAAVPGLPPNTIRLELASPDISATSVRLGLAAGDDLAAMVAPSVLRYIRERGLYALVD